MRMLRKVATALAVLLVLGFAVLAIALRHDAGCPPDSAPAPGVAAFSAVVHRCYGPPQVLRLTRVAELPLAPGHVRVRVQAASVNPLDWHFMRGEPRVMRLVSGFGAPAEPRLGADFAGVVTAVAPGVSRPRPGDRVFGIRTGSFAEFVDVRGDGAIVVLPPQVDFASGAAVPIAAITALQALRDVGKLRPGQRVLVNGASGGVGSFAVQIARLMGAEVTGVSSRRNLELVRGLGAARVIDYTSEDFTRDATRWDLVVDNVGNRPLGEVLRVLAPEGRYVMVGGPSEDPWLGPVWRVLAMALRQPFVAQRLESFTADDDRADLETLAGWLADGRLRAVIDRRYPLAAVPEAIAYLELGRARGKVVIEVTPPDVAPPAT